VTLAELEARMAADPPMTREEIEYRLAQLIRREKPSVGAIALWLKMHPPEVADDDNPFAAFATR
jgi:DNA-binding transcriptional ArsR family regulator